MPTTSLESLAPPIPQVAIPPELPLPRREAEPSEPSVDDIAADAYQRYAARGYEDGHDLEDWLAAEQDLRQRARFP